MEVPSGFTIVGGWLVNSLRHKYCEIEGLGTAAGECGWPKLVDDGGIWEWGALCHVCTSIMFPIDLRS